MIYLNWISNKVPSATLTPSSVATGFPVANLQSRYVPETWRSITGIVAATVKIDFGAAIEFDFLGAVNHNLQSAGTIIIKGGSSANPDGSLFQTSLLARNADRFRVLPKSQSWRYLTFEFSDVGNPDNFIEAGLLLVGLSAQTPMRFQPQWEWGHKFIDRGDQQGSDGGVDFSERINEFWNGRVTFDGLTEEQFQSIYDGIHEASEGSVYPLFIIPREQSYDGFFMRLVSPERPKRFVYNTISFELREQTRGVRVGA